MPDYGNMSLREELEARFKEAEQREQEAEFLSRGWRPPAGYGTEEATKTGQNAPFLTPGQRAWRSLKHDFADMGYGMKRGLSGATFGASDWALRKLGVSDDDYLAEREAEGLGTAVKGAGFVSELGGNMLGAGGALVKSLGKAGLKGLKLASTAGGIEGAATGLTGSDSLDEVLPNMAIQGTMGKYSDDERVNAILERMAEEVVKKATYYPVGYTIGALKAAKDEMDAVNRHGYDNYAHRLGMCQNAQDGWNTATYSLGLGIAKEAKDLYDKSIRGNKPWRESLADSYKDMKNNIEGLRYGLKNPDKPCRIWLKNLDYRTNKWKR